MSPRVYSQRCRETGEIVSCRLVVGDFLFCLRGWEKETKKDQEWLRGFYCSAIDEEGGAP